MKKYNLLIKIYVLLLIASLFSSCNDKKQVHSETHHGEHNHSVEELAKSFESSQRDSFQQPEKIVQYLGDIKGKTLMDIGAGTGYFSVKFADRGANVIAADVSDEFQNYLKRRIENNKIKNIELRKTSYTNPLLKDSEADIVFIANTYHHIEKRTDYFRKVKKGLNTKGELVIVDYFNVDLPEKITAPPTKMRVSVDQVVFELKKAGFTSFEIEVNLLPYHYIVKAK